MSYTPSILISNEPTTTDQKFEYSISTSPNTTSFFPITYTSNQNSGNGINNNNSNINKQSSNINSLKESTSLNINNNNNNNNNTMILQNSFNKQNLSIPFEVDLFQKGFGSFLKTSNFSDISIIADGKRYQLHKVILAHSSKYFSDYFDILDNQKQQNNKNNNTTSELTTGQYKLKLNENGDHELIGAFLEYFDSIVNYMYDGEVDLTPDNSLPILQLSNVFSIRGLKNVTTFYLTSSITKENTLTMLNKAIQIDSDDLISKCITVTCKHFNQIISPSNIDLIVATNSGSTSLDQVVVDDSIDLENIDSNNIELEDEVDDIYQQPNNNNNNNNNNNTNNNVTTQPHTFVQYKISDKFGDKSLDPSTINTIPELLSLPIGIMIRLMKQNNLSVSNEAVVYKTVLKYIQTNKSILSDSDISSLFEVVRFPLFNYQQLEEIQDNPNIPRYLLTEALLQRLKYHEGPKSDNTSNSSIVSTTNKLLEQQQQQQVVNTNNLGNNAQEDSSALIRKTPRAAYSISLEYKSDFDCCGVFYFIGTNGYKEPWSNPALRGRLRVTCSSQEKGNVINCVGRIPIILYTMDVPASWIAVNLGSSRTLVPTYYTLRHGSNSKGDSIRNWTLQGSMDTKNWTVLVRHSNDTSLNGNFATCTWKIPNCTQSFRHFRILQTGRNSSNHNFLSISGIEFYGDLYEANIYTRTNQFI